MLLMQLNVCSAKHRFFILRAFKNCCRTLAAKTYFAMMLFLCNGLITERDEARLQVCILEQSAEGQKRSSNERERKRDKESLRADGNTLSNDELQW